MFKKLNFFNVEKSIYFARRRIIKNINEKFIINERF